jgi:hypothetical protein
MHAIAGNCWGMHMLRSDGFLLIRGRHCGDAPGQLCKRYRSSRAPALQFSKPQQGTLTGQACVGHGQGACGRAGAVDASRLWRCMRASALGPFPRCARLRRTKRFYLVFTNREVTGAKLRNRLVSERVWRRFFTYE